MYACIIFAPGQVSFFSCFCSKSSQVILLIPSRLKSILSHFSSSASQFSTIKVTPRSGHDPIPLGILVLRHSVDCPQKAKAA